MSNNININTNNSNNVIKCKYCNSDIICKCGKSSLGKQRYKCGKCHRTFINDIDNRIKHNIDERKICILNYLNGMSMRGIQRVLTILYNKKIHIQSINYWIKSL